ncbi:winged helix family transcriptional regulator [Mycobacterium nebraskense]|uniref:Transcriptional regulator n=1 Tax=Mycobacterium nebraskense TaxID=244292 RepID=A0A0F5MYM8_9MYCO|nr:response regulator transcription factor [Mycobacterium nebraskense]KKB99162.1 transcriptional regulator [Mycobacterium nebraskense]KLO47104.1 transcriptional regulator [Mycobacterium nebraskense]MBI2693808.1 response regulator transcription factor [Mycobacterium nebraskense]MCV7119429.1 response regulator transcription factor [Mycobacterium nebraskense]ORW17311.1 transcriptional regulator [Mycobacterium nebraskense]
MSLDVLLLTDAEDFDRALPPLSSFARIMRRAPLTGDGHGPPDPGDVAIVDARSDLVAAQAACRRLTTNMPATAVVALVAPVDGVPVDADWNVDDVMPPGTNADEVQERLRRAIAQRRSAINGSLRFGALLLHPTSFTGSLEGKDLGLTLTEFKLLSFLVQQAGRPFTRTRLMHEAWGYDSNGRIRSVDVHVRRLRAKLGPRHQSMVDTVRGVGYMAATPPHPEWIVSGPTSQPGHPFTPAQ